MDRVYRSCRPFRLAWAANVLLAWTFCGIGSAPAQEITPVTGEPPLAGPPEAGVAGAESSKPRSAVVRGFTALSPGHPAATSLAPPTTSTLPGFPPGASWQGPARPVTDPPTPVVTLRVRVPAEVAPGKDIEYRLTVENRSQGEAHHVHVRDRLPAQSRFVRATPEPTSRAKGPTGPDSDLLWDLGTLGPMAHKEIVLLVHPEGGGDLENHAYVQFEHGQVVRTHVNQPDLRLRVTAPPRVALYQPVTFQLEVTNAGKAEAQDVVLQDEVPQGLTTTEARPSLPSLDNPLVWKLGKLAPGQSRRVEFSAATLQPGTFRDRVRLSAAGGQRQEASANVEVLKPQLSLAVRGPRWQVVGTPLTYALLVRNPGGVPSTNVEVVDRLPPEVTVLDSPQGEVRGSEVRWRLGTLPAGASRSLQLSVRVGVTGRLTNVAQVLTDNNLAERSSLSTRFVDARGPAADIEGPQRVEIGRRAGFRLRVCNPGSAPLQSVCLSLSLPEGLKMVDGRGQTSVRADGTLIHCDPVPLLGPGQEADWTIEVEGLHAGPVRLRADITTTTPGARPQAWEEVATVEAAPASPLTGRR